MRELALVGETGRNLRDAFAASELQFRRLLEKLPAGAYTCDTDGLITYYNQQAVTLWGRAPKLNDAIDRFCGSFKLFATDGTPITHDRCWMALALQNNREYNGQEIIIERPDGQRLTALAHANPIHDDDGKLIGAVNVLVDITERKRAEDALLQSDRRKDEFLATLSHELRNPLAPIRMVADIVAANAGNNSRLQWAAGLIQRQVKHLSRLVDDMLDLSRVAHGEVGLITGPADLRDIVWQAVEMNRAAVEAKRHNLWVDVPENKFLLECDSARLVQVVSNLLTNAIKFTPRGGTIHLAAAADGSKVALHIRDSGIGISPELLPHVFDMFVQGKRTLARAEGGLGIGLTLVKRIVDLHDGDVSVTSAGTGRGSVFTIRLPLQHAAAMTMAHEPSAPAADRGNQRFRVLIADDNLDINESLAMILREWGHEVRTVSDGVQAWAAACEFLPHVAILDIGLPGKDGYELARLMRQDARLAQTLLVAHSGYSECQAGSSSAAGFDHHLLKPFDLQALEKLLRQSADRSPTNVTAL